MSSEESIALAGESQEASLLTGEPVAWYDRWAAWLADHSSPILIKECRQALKSRQFLWTFLLLLLAVVGWSFWGLSATIGQNSEEAGPIMLLGYLVILAVPLFLVVPFATFRSLASELEAETMPLLTITTMTPYRIVAGKLVSGLLQLLLYLAAVVPCIAFTYLLRGVDLSEVGLLIGFQIAASVALSGVALLAAALSRQAATRWIVGIGLLCLLLISFFAWLTFQGEALAGSILSENWEVWNGLLMVLLAVATTGWVGFHTAASLVSFPASDRSSRIRRALLLQHLVFIGGLAMFGLEAAESSWITALSIFSAHYWLALGSLTSAENPGISERVRRELPQSILGQSFVGLLKPGPGRGYLFALTQIWGWQLMFLGWWLYQEWRASNAQPIGGHFEATVFFLGNAIHATFYLSFNWLLLSWIRGRRKLNPLAGLVTLALCFAILNVATLSLHGFARNPGGLPRRYEDYSIYLTFNWWSWISQALSGFPLGSSGLTDELVFSVLIVAGGALVLGAICLLRAARELVAPPGIVPERVLAELAATRKVHVPAGESIEEIIAARRGRE